MLENKEKFTQLIEEIVNSEMSEDQITEYEIEGKELIDRLFEGEAGYAESTGNNLAVGLSPEALDAIKVVTSFGALIISCISLYLEIRKSRNQRLNQQLEKTEAIRKLKTYMEEQQMAPELISKINDKYAAQIIETVDSL